MIKKILVGLDGSKLAETALPYVERAARAGGSEVILVRVVSASAPEPAVAENPLYLPYPAVRPAEPPESAGEAAEPAESAAEHYLDDVAARLGKSGIVATTSVVAGDPAPVLVEEADRLHANLIVLSTHGRSGLGRWVYGSVAEAVVARSHVPVFLARAWPAGPTAGATPNAGPILVAIDGSPRSERAIAVAADLAGPLGSEIRLLRVVPPIDAGALDAEETVIDTSPAALAEEETAARADVAERARHLGLHGPKATAAVRLAAVGTGIVDEAAESGATAIVLATHAPTGLARLLVHSVALELLHRTNLPLVLVGPSVGTGGEGE